LADVTVLFCYIGTLFALSFASVIGVGYVWIRIPRPPRARGVTASLLLLANAIWTAGVALEMLSPDLNSKIFWHVVQFSAMQTVPTLWLLYVLQYAGRQKWLTIRTYALLSVAPCATCLLALTNEFHGLVFARLAMDSMNPLMPLQEKFGLWVLGGLFYVSVLVAITSYVSIQMLVRSRQIYRRQSAALLLTLSLPWLAFAVYALEPGLLPVSLAPFVSAMAGTLFLMVNPSRLQVLDVVPVAHRVIIDGMSDPVFVLSEQRRIMQLNPAAEHLISLPAEDSIGKQMEAVIPQWSAFAEAPQKEQKETRELVIGDDTYDARSSQIVDWRGRLTSQIWVLRNITERKRMERELKQYSAGLERLVLERTTKLAASEKRFRELADLLPQIVFEIDKNGNVQYMNRAGFAATGLSEEEFSRGLNAFHFLAPAEQERATRGIQRVIAGEMMGEGEFTVPRRDGTSFPALVYTAPITREGKTAGVRGIAIDITERKRMEARLAESQRLATIGETTAMVGHDLRNPLQGIVSAIYLAKRKLESPPQPSTKPAVKPGLVDMLETIENEAKYMDKIVSDLQDYAAPLKTEPKPVEMEPLVKDTLSKIRIPRNVKVSFKVSEPLPTVMIDPAMLRRVFSNLIMNAIQAMPDGGRLEIDLYGTDEFLFIAFKDTGMGIPEENMGKLFNPLFTTKAKGQGLGLPVCKKLVEAHNGRITVESKPGGGSTFTVKLPFIKP